MGSVDLSIAWLHRLAASVQYCDAYASGATGPIYEGLFRVPASGDVLQRVKDRVRSNDEVAPSLAALEAFRQDHPDGEESTNAIASLLKWILRDFPIALVPFEFAMVDVSASGYVGVTDDAERSRIGCQLAQDLILAMATHLEGYDNAIVAEAILVVAQLFSMLCTVSRVEKISMDSHNLSVPMLPSLCNSRDPVEMVKEHTAQQVFMTKRREAGNTGATGPVSQLQLMIVYGHRIWGYVEHVGPSLQHALQAIGEVIHSSGSEQRVRKRDVLKRILAKMKPRRKSHSDAPGKKAPASETHDNFFKRLFSKKHGDASGMAEPAQSTEATAALGRFARIEKSAAVNEEDLKRLGVGRAKSVRLESPILPTLQGAEDEQVASDEAIQTYVSQDDDECTDSEDEDLNEESDSQQSLGLHGVELLRKFVAPNTRTKHLSYSKTTRLDTSTIHKVSSADPIRRVSSSRF